MADSTIILKKEPNTKDEIDNILHPFVKEWFYSKFKEYSLPQLHAVMEIHSRKNILVSAPTGATKTLTAFLSVLNELVDAADKKILENRVYAIYISPLKALNEDIKVNLIQPLEEIKAIAKKYYRELDIRVAVRGGDTTTKEKTAMLKHPPHILITTPESLAIVLSSIKFVEHLKKISWCIIDEIHAMAENKRGTHLMLSVERLEKYVGYITRIGLSATVAPLEEIAKFLVGQNRQCTIVDVQFIKQLDLKVLSPTDDLIDISYEQVHSKTYALIDQLIQEHKTTLIFTNTRAATERVVHHLKDMFPKNYAENIGAHHGSLSKEHRHSIEQRLREGKLKAVVCSTSLELGIDIGYIDLVICLGSPKTVARTLQRIGRSGHKLHAVTKGRIIVMDRDDLVECSVLLKNAVEKKIDRVYIPENALDVMAQQIVGMIVQDVWEEKDVFDLITNTYSYRNLALKDFDSVLCFLAGDYSELEDRHVYAKLWRKDGKLGKRGKMLRILYMTNLGTIPDQAGVLVKLGNHVIGSIDENFLERLKKRDIFVLGGATYEFRYARGMTAVVDVTIGKPPTVPSWVSETLPLSFDLAMEISRFRRLIDEKLEKKKSKQEIVEFINSFLFVDMNAANAIYSYIKEQHDYAKVPTDKKIIIEHYKDERGKKIMFHTLYGRRVNDCLSRAVAYVISKYENTDVEIGITDNGFYIGTEKKLNLQEVFKVLYASNIYELMNLAIDKSEVLNRRFRHCAERSLMILRTYMGRTKRVGKQQSLSTILMSALRRISFDFPILKEARREVLEDLMDIKNTSYIISLMKEDKIKIEEIQTVIPSPFSFHLVLQGYTDILKIDDKLNFLKRMHQMVLAKISLDKGKKSQDFDFSLPKVEHIADPIAEFKEYLGKLKRSPDKNIKKRAEQLESIDDRIPISAKFEIAKMINGEVFDTDILEKLQKFKSVILRKWPRDLGSFLIEKAEKHFSYEEEWNEIMEVTPEEKQEKAIEKLLQQFHKANNDLRLEPMIYFQLEKFIEDPRGSFDRKFKKWLNELLEPPIPKIWPTELIEYIKENSKFVK